MWLLNENNYDAVAQQFLYTLTNRDRVAITREEANSDVEAFYR